jgi:LacI family transcriptional regulator
MPASQPTIKDIAARAGVSLSTVHYALRRSRPISEQTRARVLAAVQELDYHPHTGAATLPTGRTGRIGVVVAGMQPAFANSYFSDFIRGLAAEAEARGHTVVLYTAYGRRAAEGWRPSHILRRREADGLVLMGTQFAPHHLDELADQGAACVLLNSEHPSLPSVVADRRQGARLATEHLLRLGRRPVALLAADYPGGGSLHAREELAGYHDALEAAGLPEGDALVRFMSVRDPVDTGVRDSLRQTLDRATRSRERAGLVVFTYTLAPQVARIVGSSGIAVPEKLSLVFGDEDRDVHRPLVVPLTTVRAPKFEMAEAAGRLLLRLIHGEDGARQQRLPMSLRIGGSCGATGSGLDESGMRRLAEVALSAPIAGSAGRTHR